MKTFEERYTAWIDGKLTGDALAAFERELADHPEAESDRTAARQIGDLLRQHADSPALSNADFFSLQLMQRIEADRPQRPASASFAAPSILSIFSRFAWGGLACLGLAAISYFATVTRPEVAAVEPSDYFAQVVEAWPSDPGISAATVYNPEDNVTVLWLDGLDYMPGDQLAVR